MTLTPPARWRMALRKSPETKSRSISILRTAEFMAASQVWGFVHGLQQLAQDRTFQRREIGGGAPAPAPGIPQDDGGEGAAFEDQKPHAPCDGAGHGQGPPETRHKPGAPSTRR